MRIYYASPNSTNTKVLPSSNIWKHNLLDTLQQNHDVIQPFENYQDHHVKCLYSTHYNFSERERYSLVLLDDIKKNNSNKKIDVFFSYFYSACIIPDVINEIRRMGIITINFYCNNIHQFDMVSEISPYYDYCMFPEKDAYNKYLKIQANPIHIQMAANPRVYRPYQVPKKYDVMFVGQKYLNRYDYISYLFNNNIDIHVWGPYWGQKEKSFMRSVAELLKPRPIGKNIHGLLTDEEMIKMYSQSILSLNFSEVLVQDNAEDSGYIKRHIRLRDFEGPMCGACYFTGYQEEIMEYYEVDKEIVCYETKEELLDKVKYYLKNPQQAEQIGIAGYKRATKDHTWENRFKKLFDKIGIK